MPDAKDDDLIRRDAIRDRVGVWAYLETSDTGPGRHGACKGMSQEKIHGRLKPPLYLACALRVLLVKVGQSLAELRGRRLGEAQPHRPYFAQIARTSDSVAKSPRAAAASDSSSSAASSGVNR